MPTTVVGTVINDDHDGHTNYSKDSRSIGNQQLFWGSNSSSDYGLEPFSYLSGISVPRGRHIVSAVVRTRPYVSNGSDPPGTVLLEKAYASSPPVSYSDTVNRTFFPAVPNAITNPWTAGTTINQPEVTKYFQELVLNGGWLQTNNGILVRLGTPGYQGQQRIVQIRAREDGGAMDIVIRYSDRDVAGIEVKNYATSSVTATGQSWYHGYRFRLARTITVSGLYGGATTGTNYVALYNDNNGLPGSVIDQASLGATLYAARRINPVVINAGWYWIACGATSSHTQMARVTGFSPANLLADNSGVVADIQPRDGVYQAASTTFGAPSVFTGKTTTVAARTYALGFDYIEGDHNIDDVTPPKISSYVVGRYS